MNADAFIPKGASGGGGWFSIIADRAEEAIAVLDTDWVVHYANAAWVRMHGYARRSEVLGKRINVFHNNEQMQADVLPLLQEVGHHTHISGPLGHINTSGANVPTHTTMVALKDEAGKVRAVIVFATDISDGEQLKEAVKGLEREMERRTGELKSAVQRLEERARETEMLENLLSARGAELSSVNNQFWQCMSARAQAEEQVKELTAQLADKDKELADLKSRLQRQSAEQMRMEQQWKMQHKELTGAIRQLHDELIEMKHREVEFLDDIQHDPEPAGAKAVLDPVQLRELRDMAKKFVGT